MGTNATTNRVKTLAYTSAGSGTNFQALTYSYTYDAMGNIMTIIDPISGNRSYTYDDMGADGTIISYNLYAYCKNNPIVFEDPGGNLGLAVAVILTGAVVGGLMGAFSAATTGGNVLESAIEGTLTGAIGAVCGLFIPNPILGVYFATMASMAVDFTIQASSQYIENGYYDPSKLDVARVKKTGLLTGEGTAIPQFGQPQKIATDAFGTALIWAEGSTLITVADVAATNITKATSKRRNAQAALYDEHALLTR